MSHKRTIYNERTAVEPLLMRGATVLVRGTGNSMTPLIKSGEVVEVAPATEVKKGDIVLAKVNGRVYLHKVSAIKQRKNSTLFQISNNHGHINGWTTEVYGKVYHDG